MPSARTHLLLIGLALLSACSNFDDVGDVAYIPPGSTSNGTTATSNGTTATSNGTTATSNGTTATSNGTTGTSNATTCAPEPEICDGLDNDCDDNTDEENPDLLTACAALPDATATGCSEGACRYTCAPGFFDANRDFTLDGCECALTAGGQEICDGLDNNCNGQPDEENVGLLTACPPKLGAVAAACSEGACVRSCVEGAVNANGNLATATTDGCECTPDPGGAELCGDGLDNDCDDLTDEGCACQEGSSQPCGLSTGACEPGTQRCQDRVWRECLNAAGPSDEICDDLDNDCDGDTDEPGPALLSACTSPSGTRPEACVSASCTFACLDAFVDTTGTPSDGCECTLSEDAREICDGLDNDCDGDIDEDGPLLFSQCDRPGAIITCTAGACDYRCQEGSFDTNGDLTRADGSNGCECTLSNNGAEICDGLDNDCDGTPDDGLDCVCDDGEGRDCGQTSGTCRPGRSRCAAGSWGPCEGNIDPDREICDGLDNDCDDTPDESNPSLLTDCPSLTGATPVACDDASCVHQCRAGFVDVNGDLSAATSDGCECALSNNGVEICDGLDNDCDGTPDLSPDGEPLSTLCFNQQGVCERASLTCTAGQISANATCTTATLTAYAETQGLTYEPTQETLCDGLDNDCDGTPDESCCQLADSFTQVATVLAGNLDQIAPAIAVANDGHAWLTWFESGDEDTSSVVRWGRWNPYTSTLTHANQMLAAGSSLNIASHRQGADLVWQDQPQDGGDASVVGFIRAFSTGADPLFNLFSVTGNTLSTPAVASRNSGETQIVAKLPGLVVLKRIDAQGRITDGFTEIAQAPFLHDVFHPDIALTPNPESSNDWTGIIVWRLSSLTSSTIQWKVTNGDTLNAAVGERSASGLLDIRPQAIPFGRGWLLVFEERREGRTDLRGLILDNAGAVASDIWLTDIAKGVSQPRLAFSGGAWMVGAISTLNTQGLLTLNDGGADDDGEASLFIGGFPRDNDHRVLDVGLGSSWGYAAVSQQVANGRRIQIMSVNKQAQPICLDP